MAKVLSMTYADMEKEIANLKKYMRDFEATTKSMNTSVTTLCDNWKADASQVYRNDYEKLSKNFDKTRGVVNELIKSTEKYISEMQKLDQSFSKSKVK